MARPWPAFPLVFISVFLLISRSLAFCSRSKLLRLNSGANRGKRATRGLIFANYIDSSTKDIGDVFDSKTVYSRVFESDARPVILFDGVCNMCNSAVNLALDWDPDGKLRFSALQSKIGRALLEANGRKADDISSIVLVTKEGAFVKSDAVLRITEELTPLSPLPLKPAAMLGRFVIPKFLRDVIYDNVADNRYQVMGKRDECRLDSEGEFEDRFVDDNMAMKKETS